MRLGRDDYIASFWDVCDAVERTAIGWPLNDGHGPLLESRRSVATATRIFELLGIEAA